jgi:hypothetical protein
MKMGEAARRKLSGNYLDQSNDAVRLRLVPGRRPTTPVMPLLERTKAFMDTVSKRQAEMLPLFETGFGYIAGACHMNVAHRVKYHGGIRIPGWIVWECQQFIDLEFHSVWLGTDGKLHDITPRKDGETEILFLPDPEQALFLANAKRGEGMVILTNRTSDRTRPATELRYPDALTKLHMLKLGMKHCLGDEAVPGIPSIAPMMVVA